MPIEIFREENDPPSCARCDEHLGEKPAANLYIFDEIHELGDEIKDGLINQAICPICGYFAWYWPGFLIVDRLQSRGVFVSLNCTAPNITTILESRLLRAQSEIPANKFAKLQQSIVWVNDYRNIYELLCEPQSFFDLEVLSNDASRRRSQIADCTVRAEQFLADSKRIGAALLTSQEATGEFLDALEASVARQLLLENLDDRYNEMLQALADQLRTRRSILHGDNSSEERDGAPSHDAGELVGSTSSDSESLIPGLNDLRRSLEALVICAREFLKSHRSHQLGQMVDTFSLILENLLDGGRSEHVVKPPEPTRLEQLLQETLRFTPAVPIDHGGEQIDLRDAIRLATTGQQEMACVAVTVVLSLAQQGRDEGCWLPLTKLMAYLSEAEPGSLARFLASALCAEFFGQKEVDELTGGALANSISEIALNSGRMAKMPFLAARLCAIELQQAGRLLRIQSNKESAMLYAGLSARMFAAIGDVGGNLRSRLDALRVGSELKQDPTTIRAIRRLLEEIGSGDCDGEFLSYEIECLSLLTDALRSNWEGPPKFLGIDLSFSAPDETKADGEVANDPPPLLLYDNVPEKADTQAEPQKSYDGPGLLYLYRIKHDNAPPYVSSAVIYGVEWFDTLQRAIRLAENKVTKNHWFNLQFKLLEYSASLGEPGLPLYFYRLMMHRANEIGFTDIPDELSDLSLLILAPSILAAGSGDRAEFLRIASVTDAIERIRVRLREGGGQHFTPRIGEHIGEEWVLFAGEMLEAAGHFVDASNAYLAMVRYAEKQIEVARDEEYLRRLSILRVTGLYRAARASLKQLQMHPDVERLLDCLDLIDRYKARRIVKGGTNAATSLSTTNVRDLKNIAPRQTGMMILALLESTEVNEGFWFSAFVDTEKSLLVSSRMIPFDEIRKPFEILVELFSAARGAALGRTVDEASEEFQRRKVDIDAGLGSLADVLFDRAVVDYIEEHGLSRIAIIPESYLFDVPFAALRMATSTGRKYFFELGPQNHGVAISVIPNWSYLGDQKKHSKKAPSGPRVMSALRPRWRGDLAPIFGASKIINLIVEEADAGIKDKSVGEPLSLMHDNVSVTQFLDGLRNCDIGVFFGHGDINSHTGSFLVANDGPVGEAEIEAALKIGGLSCNTLVVCACSGLNGLADQQRRSRDLVGVHIALLRAGVRFIIGSAEPLFAAVALKALKCLFVSMRDGVPPERALTLMYKSFADGMKLSSPIFWGSILGFGHDSPDNEEG